MEKTKESKPAKASRRSPLPWWVVALCFVALLAPFLFYHQPPKLVGCTEPYMNEAQTVVNGRTIKLQIADTNAEREQGLSGKRCIGKDQGLLFVFDKADYYPFWMKDMRFSIDIIWLDADKRIVTIKHKVQPSSYPDTVTSTEPARYVIELDAGRSEQLGLQDGQQLSW